MRRRCQGKEKEGVNVICHEIDMTFRILETSAKETGESVNWFKCLVRSLVGQKRRW